MTAKIIELFWMDILKKALNYSKISLTTHRIRGEPVEIWSKPTSGFFEDWLFLTTKKSCRIPSNKRKLTYPPDKAACLNIWCSFPEVGYIKIPGGYIIWSYDYHAHEGKLFNKGSHFIRETDYFRVVVRKIYVFLCLIPTSCNALFSIEQCFQLSNEQKTIKTCLFWV